jgi:type IV secretion system protein VirB6
VQQAYDTIRLGVMDGPQAPADLNQQNGDGSAATPPVNSSIHFQAPLPNTASLMVVTTSGFVGILRLAVGFLLAVGPLAIMGLLFEGTSGLFNGWLRALSGSALAALGVTVTTSVDLMMVESELARLQAFRIGAAGGVIDPQGLTTIVTLFAFAGILVCVASLRMAGALRLPLGQSARPAAAEALGSFESLPSIAARHRPEAPQNSAAGVHYRATSVREALSRSVHREQSLVATGQGPPTAPSRHLEVGEAVSRPDRSNRSGAGAIGRRGLGLRTSGAARRDKRA